MASDVKKALDEMKEMCGQVPSWVQHMPEQGIPAFWALLRDVEFAETHIPNKYKELIGIAVSGATRCRYCALFHTEGARLNGATEEEIAEASLMAGLTMAGSTYLNAMQTDYEQFERETREMIDYTRAHLQQQPSPRATGGAPAHA